MLLHVQGQHLQSGKLSYREVATSSILKASAVLAALMAAASESALIDKAVTLVSGFHLALKTLL